MNKPIQMHPFHLLFQNETPLMDVRAPVEFDAGHFPMSVNMPLMNDEERRLVGTCYKESGQAAAIALGHQLVNEEIKKTRVNRWENFIRSNPSTKLYCFRGGLRSQISQQWIRERGIDVEIIPGGYKALRRFLLETIERESFIRNFVILAGRTGSGKTELLKSLKTPFIDLEKHANHKGSSFGVNGVQPSQITFENRIAADFLKIDSPFPVILEDESIMIGSLNVPRNLFQKMQSSPLVVLEKTMDERVRIIIQEYVMDRNPGLDFMMNALSRIQKKLGGLNYSRISDQMKQAFQSAMMEQDSARLVVIHRPWVESLLVHYYDPFYDRALKRNEKRIQFRGNEQECREYLDEIKK